MFRNRCSHYIPETGKIYVGTSFVLWWTNITLGKQKFLEYVLHVLHFENTNPTINRVIWRKWRNENVLELSLIAEWLIEMIGESWWNRLMSNSRIVNLAVFVQLFLDADWWKWNELMGWEGIDDLLEIKIQMETIC